MVVSFGAFHRFRPKMHCTWADDIKSNKSKNAYLIKIAVSNRSLPALGHITGVTFLYISTKLSKVLLQSAIPTM